MAIEKYTTNALILDIYNVGENDLLIKVFTFDFGLIFAMAKSARKVESKLKMHLKKNRYVSITVVRGREMYRLTGAVEMFSDIKIESSSVVSEAVDRFIKAEGRHSQLFNKLQGLASMGMEKKSLRIVSYLITLIDLGYADVSILGFKDLESYKKSGLDEICLTCINSQERLRRYIKEVIENTML